MNDRKCKTFQGQNGASKNKEIQCFKSKMNEMDFKRLDIIIEKD